MGALLSCIHDAGHYITDQPKKECLFWFLQEKTGLAQASFRL